MKATGIVRRIDDLGRVVIPKEIRRTLRIREGDPLEIYTEKDGEVIFKIYSPMGELSSYAAEICESLYKSTGGTVAVCDRDSMIAVSGGGKKELLEKPVSKALEEIMENRRAVRTESGSRAPRPVESAEDHAIAVAAPIETVTWRSGARPFGKRSCSTRRRIRSATMAAPLRTLPRMALPSFSSAFFTTASEAFFSSIFSSGSSMIRKFAKAASRF